MQTVTIDRSKEWTIDDYLMLGELSTPCQLIKGALFMSPSPSPYHQTILSNIYEVLKTEGQKTGGVTLLAPRELYIDNKNVFQPDLIYISKENKNIITHRAVEGAPDLVVEVTSPSDIYLYWDIKKSAYQKIGVKEYWIVDPAHQTLEIYLDNETNPDVPHLCLVGEGQVTSTVIPSLAFDLKAIF